MTGAAFDTHTHLNHPRLGRKLEAVLERAREAGVREMLVVGYDVGSSERAVEVAEREEGVWAAVGVHPHEAAGCDAGVMGRLRELAGSERVVAIGETGLDFYRNLSPREAQEEAFLRHLALAEELGRPVIVHCREAEERLLAMMGGGWGGRLVWHCFGGSRGQAERALGLGAWLGFGGTITYRDAGELREVVAGVPEERMLLETDCPYLAPEPRRKGDNEPANLPIIAECAAGVRGTTGERLMEATAGNAWRLFGVEGR